MKLVENAVEFFAELEEIATRPEIYGLTQDQCIYIASQINDLFTEGKFSIVDDILDSWDLDRHAVELTMGILTSTYCSRWEPIPKIFNYVKLCEKTHKWLLAHEYTPEKTDRLLQGFSTYELKEEFKAALNRADDLNKKIKCIGYTLNDMFNHGQFYHVNEMLRDWKPEEAFPEESLAFLTFGKCAKDKLPYWADFITKIKIHYISIYEPEKAESLIKGLE